MATPRTSEKKSTPKKPAASAAADPTETLATDTLITLLHRGLVRLGEPARIGEVARETGEDSITPALARHIMETHSRRFVSVERY